MDDKGRNNAVVPIFPMIAGRLKEGLKLADAAGACAAAGNPDGAVRILQDLEPLAMDTATLCKAARLIRHERED